jgi:hypothetical protein
MGVKLDGSPEGFMVFWYKLLRRIFGPKRGKVTRDWTKLLNEALRMRSEVLTAVKMSMLVLRAVD